MGALLRNLPRSSRQDRMINTMARELDASAHIFGLQVRQLFQNLLRREPFSKQIKHIRHTDACRGRRACRRIARGSW